MPDSAPPKWVFQNITAIRRTPTGSWNSWTVSKRPTREKQRCLLHDEDEHLIHPSPRSYSTCSVLPFASMT